MPEISRFFGIIIRMYFNDHLPPHFHAHYGEHQVEITIETLEILKGKLPNRVLGSCVGIGIGVGITSS
jgi:hypothetical protein